MEAYSVFLTLLVSYIFMKHMWQAVQAFHSGFPIYTNSGVFLSRSLRRLTFLLVKLVIRTGSLERGAQPFKNECWQGREAHFSVYGVQMRKHHCSASVVIVFLLGAHRAVSWTASPRPFPVNNVIKEGREGKEGQV